MKWIYKYALCKNKRTHVFAMPVGGKILHVRSQNDIPCIWVMVDPANNYEERKFRTYCTGNSIPMIEQEYQLNDGAALFNCNICGDVQMRMTDDEDKPTGGCCNPECESNKNREPVPGMKLDYMDYLNTPFIDVLEKLAEVEHTKSMQASLDNNDKDWMYHKGRGHGMRVAIAMLK